VGVILTGTAVLGAATQGAAVPVAF